MPWRRSSHCHLPMALRRGIATGRSLQGKLVAMEMVVAMEVLAVVAVVAAVEVA